MIPIHQLTEKVEDTSKLVRGVCFKPSFSGFVSHLHQSEVDDVGTTTRPNSPR